jgi:hypothetical protein
MWGVKGVFHYVVEYFVSYDASNRSINDCPPSDVTGRGAIGDL